MSSNRVLRVLYLYYSELLLFPSKYLDVFLSFLLSPSFIYNYLVWVLGGLERGTKVYFIFKMEIKGGVIFFYTSPNY